MTLAVHDRLVVAAAIRRARKQPVRQERVLPPSFKGLCVYCGAPTSNPAACDAHSDLPALDPSSEMFGLEK